MAGEGSSSFLVLAMFTYDFMLGPTYIIMLDADRPFPI